MAGTLAAQPELELVDPSLEPGLRPREPRVLAPTLAPEELNRAVLNRLMQEIVHSPERTAEILSMNEEELQNTTISPMPAASLTTTSLPIYAPCAWHGMPRRQAGMRE